MLYAHQESMLEMKKKNKQTLSCEFKMSFIGLTL